MRLIPDKALIATASLIITLLAAGCAVTPEPMDIRSAIDSAAEDLQRLLADKQNPVREIDLYEAIARSLKYNRERRVALMESTIASQDLALAQYDMLPELAASAGYTSRNNPDASTSSYSKDANGNSTGKSGIYSTSSDESHATLDLGLTWNVLDFGLSYVRAQQKADQFLISKERERKAIQNLIADVNRAYWRAASSQRLLDQVMPLKRRVNDALRDSRQIEQQRLQPPLESLTYQRKLLEIRRSFEKIQKELLDARSSIATLMGMKPNARFKLKDIGHSGYQVPQIRVDIETLERHALARRPELMESRYQQRITHAEGRAALLSLLPGISLTAGAHYDDDSYLLHSTWMDYGAMITGNLINIFKYPAVQKQVDNRENLNIEKRLALMAGVMAQVHLADLSFDQARQEYTTADEYLQVVTRISEQLQLMRDIKRSGELELITEQLNTVVAELQRDMAYAELRNSYGRLFFTAGLDPFQEVLPDSEIDTIVDAVRKTFNAWEQGDIGLVTYPASMQISSWQGPGTHQFQLDRNTFLIGGNVNLNASLADGSQLPTWLTFDEQDQLFYGNPPASIKKLGIRISAQNQYGTRASDIFNVDFINVNDTPIALPGEQFAMQNDKSVIMGQLEVIDPDNDRIIFQPAQGETLPTGMRLEKDGLWTYKAPPYYALSGPMKRTVRVEAVDPYNGRGETEIVIGTFQ